uniref:Uncharacterized protein n=1 Tax=Sus scrofa TaxID=9823 RepID=A0A8D0UZN7_PIG
RSPLTFVCSHSRDASSTPTPQPPKRPRAHDTRLKGGNLRFRAFWAGAGPGRSGEAAVRRGAARWAPGGVRATPPGATRGLGSPGPTTCGGDHLTCPVQFQPVGVAALGHQDVGLLLVGSLLPWGRAAVATAGAAALAAAPLGEAVAVPPVRVAVAGVVAEAAVMVEEAEPQHVDHQPRHADPEDHQRLLHLVRLDEALDGLQQDGEAEAGQKDGVHQSPHHFGPDPAERVLLGGVGPPGEALGHQRHHQRQHVRQHVEGVREHRQRRGHPAHHHLQDHEHEGLPLSGLPPVWLGPRSRRLKS